MMERHLTYRLKSGYINDWLVLGPVVAPVSVPMQAGEEATTYHARVLKTLDRMTCDFAEAPREVDKVERFGQALYWEVEHCQDDHLVERDVSLAVYGHARVWAFARLTCSAPASLALTLTLYCPASVWLNGEHLTHCDHVAALEDQGQFAHSFVADLGPGDNDLLVRLEQVAAGDAVLAMALHVDSDMTEEIEVRLPTVTEDPERRQEWERALEFAYLDRAIYQRNQTVTVICGEGMPGSRPGSVRLQQPDGVSYARIEGTFKTGERIEGLAGAQLASGRMQALLTPRLEDYSVGGFRARRVLPFTVNRGGTYSSPVGTADDRLIALVREIARNGDDLHGQLARMAVGSWKTVEPKVIRNAIERVNRREANCPEELLGLVVMRLRMGQYSQFPSDVLNEIDACLLAFDYGDDPVAAVDPSQESNQLLLLVAQVLAGQAYGKRTFASGRTGRLERKRGEKQATTWLRRRAQTGFTTWNSHLATTVGALALLADLAEGTVVRDLATVLADKVLFGLAVNSFKGAYAAPRADARASWLRSGVLAPEAPVNFLLWGMGGLNTHIRGVLGLGLSAKNYRSPDVLRSIALDRWPDMLSRERQQVAPDEYVNTVTFKTPDAMLASAQDYRAGQRGRREHIWQATLGHDAVVFTNHPTSFSDADARHAAWWCGNGRLPRVAQWNDSLIALYRLPEDDPLGFTHAFFPSYAFDEHVLEGGWAFARAGAGYLALHATGGMSLVTSGNDAMHELRAMGKQTAWLCQVGRAETDGSFEDFRRGVLSGSASADGLHVQWKTVRGQLLAFDWTGPLLVDGQTEPVSDFKHVENPYGRAEFPAKSMDIGYGEDILRLHLA